MPERAGDDLTALWDPIQMGSAAWLQRETSGMELGNGGLSNDSTSAGDQYKVTGCRSIFFSACAPQVLQ